MANIAFFDIPADNVGRAKHFYSSLFGWKINLGKTTPDQEKIAAMQYHAVLTGEAKEGTMNMGGLYKRQMNETIKNYVEVEDIDAVLKMVERLGGRIMMPKEMIPGVGLVAMIRDTEGNGIGVWKPVMQ
ncbi:MAG: VOC family protein [Methanoregula sp.]|nr:VOC family protein [Methanoregula sp.]